MGNRPSQQYKFEGAYFKTDFWNRFLGKQEDRNAAKQLIQGINKSLADQSCSIFSQDTIRKINSQKNRIMVYHRAKSLLFCECKNDQATGKGIIVHEDGAIFQGEFLKEKMDGPITMYNGQQKPILIGKWKDGKFSSGTIQSSQIELTKQQKQNYLVQFRTGVMYQGQIKYENDQLSFEGKGKIVYRNNESYDGGWKNSKKHGQGKYYFSQANYLQGRWQNGELVKGLLYNNNEKVDEKG